MSPHPAWLALWLASSLTPVLAQSPGSFVQAGNTQVSAMMMFLGNEEKVYIIDKSENNQAQINNHPAWGAVWDIASRTATVMDIATNSFCAAGLHLPNGSYATFGGNGAIGPNASEGDVLEPGGFAASFDTTYQDGDGRKSIRILNPCTGPASSFAPQCEWFDNPDVLSMQTTRWYASAEALADGTIALIGGFANGGYINRNYPNVDPTEGGAAILTTEFYPSRGPPQEMAFMRKTSGLNSYAHAFLMPSGNMLVQANYSTVLWNPETNAETPLPDMPNQIVRVYPASGSVAMLPLTPANNYNPTVLFCGGTFMPDQSWGDYKYPYVNTFDIPASNDCQRITPEPTDGSAVNYVQDDDMLMGRTMGQFIHLPDQTMLVINGGANGTAGYTNVGTLVTPPDQMPFDESLASGPVLTPAIYNPNAAAGSRWSDAGLSASTIPRLYHSSALLLPDASVLVAGSNPNLDVNTSAFFPTTYTAEIFYPPYFAASTRPQPTGWPSTLTYGGAPFDITIPASSYSGSANDAADNTTVMLIRPGWTTHAMNMGQRSMQLNNTYTVNQNGTIVLHVSPPPPNANLLQPGPVLMFVVMSGIPSNGTMAIVGTGAVGTQPTANVVPLPANIRVDTATGSASGSSNGNSTGSGSGSSSGDNSDDSNDSSSTSHTGAIVGGIIGAIAVVGIVGALLGICISRRRRARAQAARATTSNGAGAVGMRPIRDSDASAFVPLQQGNSSMAWNASSASLNAGGQHMSPPGSGLQTPYRDVPRQLGQTPSGEFDPYYAQPQTGRSTKY